MMVKQKHSTRRKASRKNSVAPKPKKYSKHTPITESKVYAQPQPFYPHPAKYRTETYELPGGYGDNKIVLMVRDPWWLYAYWEISQEHEANIRAEISRQGLSALKSILRVYDITAVQFNGSNAHSFFDIELKDLARNWYINTANPNRSYCVDIGILTKSGKLFTLARSNVVHTPRFGMSDVLDEEWMCSEEDYWRLFGLSGGFGIGKSSLAMKEMLKKRLMEQITSGVSSISSPMKKAPEKDVFWLVVDAELIVYGATEPDAKVTVCAKPIKLRKDGTFTLRFALPDTQLHIPVEATSNNGKHKRKITPVVTRYTEK